MKKYQITYREFGNLKYCYTIDFTNFYLEYGLKTIIKLENQFHEKVQQVQREKGL